MPFTGSEYQGAWLSLCINTLSHFISSLAKLLLSSGSFMLVFLFLSRFVVFSLRGSKGLLCSYLCEFVRTLGFVNKRNSNKDHPELIDKLLNEKAPDSSMINCISVLTRRAWRPQRRSNLHNHKRPS